MWLYEGFRELEEVCWCVIYRDISKKYNAETVEETGKVRDNFVLKENMITLTER